MSRKIRCTYRAVDARERKTHSRCFLNLFRGFCYLLESMAQTATQLSGSHSIALERDVA